MRPTIAPLIVLWVSSAAVAAPPRYMEDPFGDDDFEGAPLILSVAHPSRDRAEISLLFASSISNKYNAHAGGFLQVEYNLTNTFGLAVAGGLLHGTLTPIVTGDAGIIGKNMAECIDDASRCGDINPDVPDTKQVTGVLQALAVWSPLYGKINVVSEVDLNLQAYVLLGVGVNGTRVVNAVADSTPGGPGDYRLEGGGFLDGGLFSRAKVHVSPGVGLRIFLSDWLALRLEARGLLFSDEFRFERELETYLSHFWFLQAGVGVILI